MPDPYTNSSFLVPYRRVISLLVIARDKIPPIKPGGASLAIAAIGSAGPQSRLSVPSSSAGWDTAQVHMLQVPKDGLVQWCICKGCLTLIFIFKNEEGLCFKKTSSLVLEIASEEKALRKKISQELFVPKYSAGNTPAPLRVWDARMHTTHNKKTSHST